MSDYNTWLKGQADLPGLSDEYTQRGIGRRSTEREQMFYNSSFDQYQMYREDNQLTRLVADAEKAGISPIHALGKGGSYGSISSGVGSGGQSSGQEFSAQMQGMAAAANMGKIHAEKDVLKAQAENLKAQTQQARQTARRTRVEGDYLEETLSTRIQQVSEELTGQRMVNEFQRTQNYIQNNTAAAQIRQALHNELLTQSQATESRARTQHIWEQMRLAIKQIEEIDSKLLLNELAIATQRIANYQTIRDLVYLEALGLPSFIRLDSIPGMIAAGVSLTSKLGGDDFTDDQMDSFMRISQELLYRLITGQISYGEFDAQRRYDAGGYQNYRNTQGGHE